jgi:hypothetical protein
MIMAVTLAVTMESAVSGEFGMRFGGHRDAGVIDVSPHGHGVAGFRAWQSRPQTVSDGPGRGVQ